MTAAEKPGGAGANETGARRGAPIEGPNVGGAPVRPKQVRTVTRIAEVTA